MLGTRLKQITVLAFDAVLVTAALFISYWLRFGTIKLGPHYDHILTALPLVLASSLIVFFFRGLYKGMWRFIGVRDLVSIIESVTLSSLISVSILYLAQALPQFPRSVFIINWFILIFLIGGSRLVYRIYRTDYRDLFASRSKDSKNVLILGAGRAGETILREILSNYALSYSPVGFVDDERKLRNRTIHGYPVLGNTREIPLLVEKLQIDCLFIAMPTASNKAKRRILNICKNTGLHVKTLPGVAELINGNITVSALREFQIEDLLGRDPVSLDLAAIQQYLCGKTVMITGAGGSIGSELCRRVAHFQPKRLVLFERSEFNLYQINMNLQELFPHLNVIAVIGDTLNENSITKTLSQYKPDVIFHAAAYKHVPLMELNFVECLRNNVFGTWNIANLAVKHGVQKFVMVSTDKAVRPTNIMGASKRIAELICQGFSKQNKTRFLTVRFGNVLNSVGSVVPLFNSQIEKGGPLTVTHPRVYRYFMTIPEAVQLIMQAGAMGKGGEVFILDMGEPVKILDLARDMIRLSGLEPDKDVQIRFTGLRPGEKLYEELLTDGEEIQATLHEKIKVASMTALNWPAFLNTLDDLLAMLNTGSIEDILENIKKLVPEYQPEMGGPGSLPVDNSNIRAASRNEAIFPE